MDLGTHFTTGLVASTFVEDPTSKLLCIIGSVLPDMVFVPYYVYRTCTKDWHFWRHLKKDGPPPHHPQWEVNAYNFVHSFVFLGCLLLIASTLQNHALWGLCLGVATHIAWDIPTHTGKWAHKPLYPFLNWKIEGFHDWWRHTFMRKFVVVGWAIMLSLYFFIF